MIRWKEKKDDCEENQMLKRNLRSRAQVTEVNNKSSSVKDKDVKKKKMIMKKIRCKNETWKQFIGDKSKQ